MLILFSTITLTIAEGYLFPTALTIPIAFLTLYLTDIRKIVVIDPTLAGIFGIVAIIGSGTEFFSGLEQRILSAAHMLTYFVWIVLFQEKRLQNYWTLAALSLLQMAIAATLTSHLFYGGALVLYTFAAIWTLVIFSVYRAGLRVRMISENLAETHNKPATNPDQDTTAATSMAHKQIKRDPMEYLNPTHSTSRGSIHLESGRRWISYRLVFGVVFITVISVMVGAMFFIGTPRLWLKRFNYPSDFIDNPIGRTLTGFTESVQLGQTGEIRENLQPAFTVQFESYDADNSAANQRPKVYSIPAISSRYGQRTPYFRGNTLETYLEGRWSAVTDRRQNYDAPEIPQTGKYIRQLYVVDSVTGTRLFNMLPAIPANTRKTDRRTNSDPVNIRINYINDAITAYSMGSLNNIEYSVFTPEVDSKGYRNRLTTSISDKKLLDLERSTYLSFITPVITPVDDGKDPDRLKPLIELAQQWKQQAQEKSKTPLSNRDLMLAFEERFVKSPEFEYTLKQSIEDRDVDPVIDFLFNRKSGHCEYFSSALTLMLRAIDIPTRMVAGYKGGDWNEKTMKMTVLQKYAHTWVEALDLESKEWVSLDPTPAIRDARIADFGEEEEQFAAYGYSDNIWKSYVVGLSLARQKELFYEPFIKFGGKLYAYFNVAREAVQRFLIWLKDFIIELFRNPEKLFSWQGGLVVSSLGGLLIGFVWLLSRRREILTRLGLLKRSENAQQRLVVEFYERFARLMRRYHLQRETVQTHREFASLCHEKFAPLVETPHQLNGIEELTEAYYQWRFGNHEFTPDYTLHLMQSLETLEQALKTPKSVPV